MKVKVNKDICIGCGACQAIAPEIFEIEDDGLAKAIPEEISGHDTENAMDALEGCPVGAIEKIDK